MRLINLDKLLADLYVEEAEGTVSMGISAIYEIVLKQPTIVLKYGHWQGVNPLVDSLECSECRYEILSEELKTPYCPWCGAKMDEVTE